MDNPWRVLTDAAIERTGAADASDLRDAITGTLELADQWERGECSLTDVRERTEGYLRFLAARSELPLRPSMVKLLDTLIDTTETAHGYVYRTTHGCIPESEIRRTGGEITRTGGILRIDFPIRYRDGRPYIAVDADERWRLANEN